MIEHPPGAEKIDAVVSRQQVYYQSGETRPVAFRKEQLNKLREAVQRREPELLAALKQDLNKSEQEAYTTEIGIVLKEISTALRGVRRWAKPRKVRTPITHLGASSRIVPEPYGTTLIIGPWNYPVNLILVPLVSAIAAGNTIVVKPSELAPAASKAVASLLRDTFPAEYVAVFEGETSVSTELLKRPFDHIFFTGSPAVGRIVMEAAAKQLIPVTLELGGKSPCIVHKDANIPLAAKRIVFGKLTNAGQTCVAPDYLLVHKEAKPKLMQEIAAAIESFYGKEPIRDPDYGKIVNERHFRRLIGYLDNGKITLGGQYDATALKIAPTLMEDVPSDSPAMREEIFGPILPVLEYDTIEGVLAIVQANPKPLALYVFSESVEFQDLIAERVSFGGGCINDTIVHLGTPYLPFGGVGTSGIGSYHGEYGFKAFSHYKSILKQTNRIDFPFRYPKSKRGLSIIRKLLR
ncbi:aldehyde dehydrogenase [Cohnella terricola]|uniref:Aldehyde dehydrogenase n=1 Tax=Cohnella terricola TaxID=1289167 RepID=A0A559JTY7_9BACL|nr:aldehyde dehydrogenase [Cohnella terricola]TVY03341.1 aldehyde dehydrogenase [Cohnella terricola]